MGNITKPGRSDRNRKMITGVQKHLAGAAAFVIDGVSHTPATVEKTLQGPIDAADTTATATAAFHKATAAEREAIKEGDALYRGMRGYLVNLYRLQPDVLADFGIELTNRQVPDASTVAQAVVKRADTRAARHTMGKRQKAAVKGTSAPKAPTASTSAAATTPVAPPKAT